MKIQFWSDRVIKRWPQLSIVSVYCFVTLLILVPFYKLMPVLLSYAPGVRQNPQIHTILYGNSYVVQYWTVILLTIIVHIIPLAIALRNIGKWKQLVSQEELTKESINKIKKIRKKSSNIPYYVILAEITFPLIAIFGFGFYVFFTEYYHIFLLVNVIKLILLYFSILSSIGIVSFIFTKRICRVILLNTDIDGSYPGFRITFRYSLALQMILMFIVGIMITALAGYAKLIEEKGDLLFTIHKRELSTHFDEKLIYPVDTLKNILGRIRMENHEDAAFYLGDNGDEYVSDGLPLYKDFVVYLKYLADKYDGKVHVLTGELQGTSMKIQTDRGPYRVGIKYLVASKKMAAFFIVCFIALLLFNSAIFFYFSRSISNDIKLVTDNLNMIARNDTVNLEKKIPVVSNDEIGDLTVAFNRIQTMTRKHIEYVRKSENIIREQERLASLGQMIGGIAHNLRSPIMSLAGGLEGLDGLIGEYDMSIDNDSVTPQDHHAIAGEMREWIGKLKPYCSYMSDVISTVKDHSVLNETSSNTAFSVEELFKRVKILSRDAASSKNCRVNFHGDANQALIINGNITILVQVMNNLIENACDAYKLKGGNVDISVTHSGDAITLLVKDYGDGIPEKIKNRLFKEMVTSKGNGGTGLGLYISQSRIISSFQGIITCESECGKGTTMAVVIPRHREVIPRTSDV